MMRLLLIPLCLLAATSTVAAEEPKKPQPISSIWLTHKTNDPSKIVVNWMSDEADDSVVRFGLTDLRRDALQRAERQHP